jgi:intracellular sulfur oxidation DsrE/DsrF family protein
MTTFKVAVQTMALLSALCLAALPAAAQTAQPAPKLIAPAAEKKAHRLIVQVNANDPALMNLALNNVANVEQYYTNKGERVEIQIVTFGPGLHMLREDTSPVKERIKQLADTSPSVSFIACGNTRANMSRVEKKEIPLISEATVVKSGVVRVMELQEQGWSYVRP